MNKIVKGCIVGSAIYGTTALGFMMGKGYMLGAIASVDTDVDRALTELANDKHPYRKAVAFVAKMNKERTEKWVSSL